MNDSIDTFPSTNNLPSTLPGNPVVVPQNALVGQLLGERYRVVRRIGEGGMASVYIAEHTLIGRQVAIKVLHQQYAENNDCVRRFLAEGRTAGTLGHPNIVESTDMGFTPSGAPFMVLELLEGKDLDAEISTQGSLSVERSIRIGVQIASGVAAAHARGIIHRDLKSPNIFLVERRGDDHVKVIDFGISKFIDARCQTQKGLIFGTPSFMSPEQINDSGAVDHRTDIYALGVILYHMLSGRLPFDQDTMPVIITKILSEQPLPIEQLRPDLPIELTQIIRKAMAKSVGDRFATMADMGSALANLVAPPFLESPSYKEEPGDFRLSTADLGSDEPRRRVSTPISFAPVRPQTENSPKYAEVLANPIGNSGEQKVVGRRRPILRVALLAACIGGLAVMAFKFAQSPKSTTRPKVAVTSAPVAAAIAKETPVANAEIKPSVAPPAAPQGVATAPIEPAMSAAKIAAPTHEIFAVNSPVAGAKVKFRGETHPLPFKSKLARGEQPELVEIFAPGYQRQRSWITLDQPRIVHAELVAINAETPRPAPAAPPAASIEPAPAEVVAIPAAVTPTVPPPSEPAAPPKIEPKAAPPARAPAVAGPPPGTMNKDATRQAVQRHFAEVQTCFERGRMDDPMLSGQVIVQMVIAASGKVTSAQVTSTTLKNRAVETCLISEIETWTLPAPAGGVAATIKYPFMFQ